jgi:hypothetical protein
MAGMRTTYSNGNSEKVTGEVHPRFAAGILAAYSIHA